MIMKKSIFYFAVIALFASCKTYQAAWDYPQNDSPDRISFEHLKTKEVITYLPKKVHLGFSENIFDAIINSYEFNLVSFNDSRKLMINNYLGPDSLSNYPTTCQVTLFKTKHYVDMTYIVPTVLTLSIINLFGFPITSHEVELDLKVELVDKNGKLTHTYFAKGSNKSYAAYYWGYTGVGAANKESELGEITEKLALKEALESISLQLSKDFE